MMKLSPSRLFYRRVVPYSTINRLLSTAPPNRTETARFQLNQSHIGTRRISTTPRKAISAVNPLLGEGYEVGGRLAQVSSSGKESSDVGRPTWGKSSISTNFSSPEGDRVFHAPNFWLRDHCRCEKCVNQDTMQRAFDTFQIAPQVAPKEVVAEKGGLRVTWGHDGISDGHISLYPWEWLKKQSLSSEKQILLQDSRDYHLWGEEIRSQEPVVHYDEIMSHEKGVGAWTEKIRKYGFCYVEGCPVSPEKTEELLERIAFIRVTHYGGFYDFTSDLTMKDTAYTSLALGAHTDTTYFTDPAGLQMFHLLSHTDGSGGASLLVDGFNAANRLRQESPESWDTLASVPILWHASGNEGITITPSRRFPVLNINSTINSSEGINSLSQVRWNNDDRGLVPVQENGSTSATEWYDAARKFDEILKRDDMQYWAQMKPGRPLIFDNWRVMHGRSSFSGKRRICGGYINHDDFISRWRNTNFSREAALGQLL